MGWLVWLASPTYRRRFLDNSAQAGYGFGRVAAAIAHAGRMVAELPRMWLRDGAGDGLIQRTQGAQAVEDAWARGRGIIFLTPHLGCFELSVQAIARRWAAQHGTITILYRPARQAWLADLMRTARNRAGIEAVPTNLAGVRQMIKALRRGHAVGLLPDQVPPEGQGMWAPFFGKPAYSMTLAARLALQTGAAVILVRCERLSRGRGYALFFEPLDMDAAVVSETSPDAVEAQADSADAALRRAVLRINAGMERTIAHCPEQYLWGYGRYKQPRPGPGSESATPPSPPPSPSSPSPSAKAQNEISA